MNDENKVSDEILAKSEKITSNYPQLARDLAETPVQAIDYEDPNVNEQEMEDYRNSLSSMMEHTDATSTGDNGEMASNPRPDARRVLDAPHVEFDLNVETDTIKLEGNWAAGNQSAKTLVKSDNMRVVLMAMHEGNEMKEHEANGPISLQVLEGSVEFKTQDTCLTLKAGHSIALHKNVPHSLVAKEQSIMLLTVVNLDNIGEEDLDETGFEGKIM